jgi:signal transduction histidine kinase
MDVLSQILLVDDEPRLLRALKRPVSEEFNVLTATSGDEALDVLAKNTQVKVIVADMQMPGMNGIELLKNVKARFPSLRRVMLTGNADMETAIAAINEGEVMRFLRKPCDTNELITLLRQGVEEYDFHSVVLWEPVEKTPTESQADKARQAFLAMMNHELRTPLNQIIGFASVLKDDPKAFEGEDSLDALGHIKNSGEHMLMLVNRILEFSRLQSENPATTEQECESFDLLQTIINELLLLDGAMKEKSLTLSIDCLRKKVDVMGSESEVKMAIRELLQNAVKFNDANGHISIAVKCDLEHAAVRIFNTGQNIPTELLDMIKEPFRLGDESYSREHEGIGLGLAIVSAVAEINQARFDINSDDAGGIVASLAFHRKHSSKTEDTQLAKAG